MVTKIGDISASYMISCPACSISFDEESFVFITLMSMLKLLQYTAEKQDPNVNNQTFIDDQKFSV